jgi:hypothetical protein
LCHSPVVCKVKNLKLLKKGLKEKTHWQPSLQERGYLKKDKVLTKNCPKQDFG